MGMLLKSTKGDPDRGRPSAGPVGYWPAGTMLMTRRPRRVPNSTLPSTSANNVSSPPRPTPVPGWKWVPRWRTMISPALTSWPPYRFTPRRWALLSRPFLLDPRPFLCAMTSSYPRSLLGRGAGGAGRVDRGHLDLRVVLPVSLTLAVAGLVLELQDVDLGTLGGSEDLGLDVDLRQLAGV